MAHRAWLFSSVASLAFALIPVSLPAQGPVSARDAVVWHWFGSCTGGDSMVVEVSLDGKPLYSSTFPICRVRRRDIKPEPQQRLLEFRFDGVPRRFGPRDRSTQPQSIGANIWEAGGDPDAILLGVSFATAQQVLLNMVHVAHAKSASR